MVILQVLLCKLIDVLDDAVPWDVGAKYDVNRGEEPQYIPRDARLMPMVSRLSLAQKQWLSSQLFMQGAEAHVAHLSWFELMDRFSPDEAAMWKRLCFCGFREDLDPFLPQLVRDAKIGKEAWPGCCPPRLPRQRPRVWWVVLDPVESEELRCKRETLREHFTFPDAKKPGGADSGGGRNEDWGWGRYGLGGKANPTRQAVHVGLGWDADSHSSMPRSRSAVSSLSSHAASGRFPQFQQNVEIPFTMPLSTAPGRFTPQVAFLAYDGERQRPLPKAPTVSYSFKVALVAMDCVLLGAWLPQRGTPLSVRAPNTPRSLLKAGLPARQDTVQSPVMGVRRLCVGPPSLVSPGPAVIVHGIALWSHHGSRPWSQPGNHPQPGNMICTLVRVRASPWLTLRPAAVRVTHTSTLTAQTPCNRVADERDRLRCCARHSPGPNPGCKPPSASGRHPEPHRGTGRPGVPMYRSLRSFVSDAHHNRLLATPAGLYAINNHLKFAMQLFFRPTTTKMLGNLKIFVIALLMRTILRRTFSTIQWEALFLLVAGITVNQLHSHCPVAGAIEKAIPLLPAALCTLGTITVPSAASVYNEYALKRHMDTSVHLQNFFLYFYGALFNVGILLTVSLYEGISMRQMFAGQSTFTYLLIANNAAQGILSSFFFKYADTILKKYSSTLATIFTALMSYALFGHELSTHFFIGVSIVLVSMHQFFTFGGKGEPATAVHRAASKMVFSPSLEHISTAGTSPLHARSCAASPMPSHNGGGFFSSVAMAAATPSADPPPHADEQALLLHRGDSFSSRRPSLLPR
ncbi:MAG: hypothetical protein WDW38_010150 [Sanguina aurantia]